MTLLPPHLLVLRSNLFQWAFMDHPIQRSLTTPEFFFLGPLCISSNIIFKIGIFVIYLIMNLLDFVFVPQNKSFMRLRLCYYFVS